MRLALVQYSSNFGGSTISGQMISDGMIERGWDVDVFFGFDGPFVESQRSEACTTHVVEHRNWLRAPGLLRFVKNMRAEQLASAAFEEAFKRTKPDLVYINTLVSYAAARAASRLGIPVVWHVRELFADDHGELSWPAGFAKSYVRGRIIEFSTRLVVNSSAVAANVFGAGNTAVAENVPNAVDPKFFAPRGEQAQSRANLGLPTDVPLIGLPGTLRFVKGHEFLFRAIPRILEQLPTCQFVITGAIDSGFANSMVEMTTKGPLDGHVIFTGAISDMLSFYHGCDACCVPSLSEPFGRTAIECFATRTPLVASAVGGLREIVRHDENALLVPYDDTTALADSLLSLMTDAARRDRLVERAVIDANERYTEAAYSQRIADIIDETLSMTNKPQLQIPAVSGT